MTIQAVTSVLTDTNHPCATLTVTKDCLVQVAPRNAIVPTLLLVIQKQGNVKTFANQDGLGLSKLLQLLLVLYFKLMMIVMHLLRCHDPCPFGTYGLNCSEECGSCLTNRGTSMCEPDTGLCLYGCLRGWGGSKCDHGILCDPNPCKNDGTCQQTGSIYR